MKLVLATLLLFVLFIMALLGAFLKTFRRDFPGSFMTSPPSGSSPFLPAPLRGRDASGPPPTFRGPTGPPSIIGPPGPPPNY